MQEMAGDGSAMLEPKKPSVRYREIKDTSGGLWYIRKKLQAPMANDQIIDQNLNIPKSPESLSSPIVVGDEAVHGHENIKDVEIKANEIAEDFVIPKKDETVDSGLILPGSEIELDDENTIKPGESIEL
jgi:hypothetical protein